MPYLFELLTDKTMLDIKIDEIKSILKHEQNDSLTQELFSLLDRRQSKLLNIDAANNISVMNVGGIEINISAVLIIKNTMKEKIDILTSMINDINCHLDKIELQKQRDRYYGEYVLLSMGIDKNDLTVTVE